MKRRHFLFGSVPSAIAAAIATTFGLRPKVVAGAELKIEAVYDMEYVGGNDRLTDMIIRRRQSMMLPRPEKAVRLPLGSKWWRMAHFTDLPRAEIPWDTRQDILDVCFKGAEQT